jgi:hypothetical protein
MLEEWLKVVLLALLVRGLVWLEAKLEKRKRKKS